MTMLRSCLIFWIEPPLIQSARRKRMSNRVALAATLATGANDWLRSKPDIYERVTSILKEAIKTVGDSSEGFRQRRIANMSDQLKVAAYGVMHLWLNAPEQAEEWELY